MLLQRPVSWSDMMTAQSRHFQLARSPCNQSALICICIDSALISKPPVTQACPVASSSQSHQTVSETISRGSSAILDEIADLDSFAPDTPPQNVGLLAAECSSEYDPHTGMSSMCH